MANASGFEKRDSIKKKTSIGGNHTMIKTSSMNKSKRQNYKKYRGQGRWLIVKIVDMNLIVVYNADEQKEMAEVNIWVK